MSFILKVVLIILLNKTYAYITQDSEIILLPAWNPTVAKKISLTLKAFGKQIQLNLCRNDRIVSSAFKVWKHNTKGIMEELSQLNTPDSCYYFHDDHVSTAAINFCQEHGLKGVVFLGNTILDIRPLQNNLASSSLIGDSYFETETNISFGKPHLIKRSLRHTDWNQDKPMSPQLTIKLAVLLDNFAYDNILPIVDGNDTKIRDIVLAYINGLQAVFHHPSLGVRIDILLSILIIVEKKQYRLTDIGADADELLKTCCNKTKQYLTSYRKWDIAIYLTGLDLYRWNKKLESATKDTTFRGFSAINNSCNSQLSCAVVEFGVSCDEKNKHCQPNAGFASIYSAAHEIGRLLGMENDNTMSNECSKDNYIMTDVREGFHTSIWSTCSRKVAAKLWQTKPCLLDKKNYSLFVYIFKSTTSYHLQYLNFNATYNFIKREWTAKKQCELYLKNKDANVVTLLNVCQYLQCEEPNKTNYVLSTNFSNYEYKFNYSYFFAGPALEGTHCAFDSECQNGECVRIYSDKPLISDHSEKSNWSEWKEESCSSYCLEKSKGVIAKRRICRDENNKSANCEGESYDVKLCDDSTLCNEIDKPRLPINEFINMNCAIYKSRFLHLHLTGKGIQDIHDFKEPWLACTIYCLQEQEDDYVFVYYAPRMEVITLGLDPYLPDGTWCHTEDDRNYYCRKRLCLPEN